MPPPKLGGSRGIGPAVVRRIAAVGWDVSFSCHHDGQTARGPEGATAHPGWLTGGPIGVTR